MRSSRGPRPLTRSIMDQTSANRANDEWQLSALHQCDESVHLLGATGDGDDALAAMDLLVDRRGFERLDPVAEARRLLVAEAVREVAKARAQYRKRCSASK